MSQYDNANESNNIKTHTHPIWKSTGQNLQFLLENKKCLNNTVNKDKLVTKDQLTSVWIIYGASCCNMLAYTKPKGITRTCVSAEYANKTLKHIWETKPSHCLLLMTKQAGEMTAEQPSNSTRQASTSKTLSPNQKTRLFWITYLFNFIVKWWNPQKNKTFRSWHSHKSGLCPES